MNFEMISEKLLDYLSDDPNFCALYGLNKNLGDMPDPGKNKLIQKQGKLRLLSKMINQLDRSTLSKDEALDLHLIELTIERENVRYETEIGGVLEIFRKPVAASTIIDPIYTFLINDDREPKYRLVNIVSRIQKIPEFLKSMQRNTNRPIQRWVDIEIQSIESIKDLFSAVMSFATENHFKNTALLEDVISKASVAIKSYVHFLNKCDKSHDFFIGVKAAERIVKSNGINLSLKEIHKIAEDFNKQNNLDIETLRLKLVKKYELPLSSSKVELQSFLNKKFSCEDILSEYEKCRDSIEVFLKEKDILTVPKDQDFKIVKTPDFMKSLIPAGAMCPPLPLRDGIKKSIIFLTLDDSNSSDHNLLTIPPMMVHEGIPGHHLQFSYAAKNDSLIRKIFMANDLSEGWATYFEEYLFELGFSKSIKDEVEFITKRDMARLGARVAIDLYFMTGDKSYLDIGSSYDDNLEDPFELAESLLISVTGFTKARAKGELNWYSMERGYPMTYLLGNKTLKSLKSKLNLSDKEFHQYLLNHGNMPLSLIK